MGSLLLALLPDAAYTHSSAVTRHYLSIIMSAFNLTQLENRIVELESRLQAETNGYTTTQNALRKSERHIKELTFKAEEDRKNHAGMITIVDELQNKLKTYSQQLSEAEEIAALNLAKYNKANQELDHLPNTSEPRLTRQS